MFLKCIQQYLNHSKIWRIIQTTLPVLNIAWLEAGSLPFSSLLVHRRANPFGPPSGFLSGLARRRPSRRLEEAMSEDVFLPQLPSFSQVFPAIAVCTHCPPCLFSPASRKILRIPVVSQHPDLTFETAHPAECVCNFLQVPATQPREYKDQCAYVFLFC